MAFKSRLGLDLLLLEFGTEGDLSYNPCWRRESAQGLQQAQLNVTQGGTEFNPTATHPLRMTILLRRPGGPHHLEEYERWRMRLVA